MKHDNPISPTWKFIIAILLCESVGIISGLLASANNNMWFNNLNKPTQNSPACLFGPVWTTLYLLIGISLSLIWRDKATELNKRNAYLLFATQLFLNFWWSIFFFHFHSPALSLVNGILMVVMIILTILSRLV